MAKKATNAAERFAEFAETIERLQDQIATLVQAVDELRDEVAFLNRNGVSVSDEFRAATPSGYRVRQMAADPCAADWNERLVVEPIGMAPVAPLPPVKQTPPVPRRNQSPTVQAINWGYSKSTYIQHGRETKSSKYPGGS